MHCGLMHSVVNNASVFYRLGESGFMRLLALASPTCEYNKSIIFMFLFVRNIKIGDVN